MKKKYFFKAIVFLLLFTIPFNICSYVLRDKTNAELVYDFKNIKEPIDILFFGSSHMYRTIQPMELWNQYGIASYNLGSSEQSIPLSYYMIKDAINRNKPKVVILDLYMMKVSSKDYTHERIHQVLDNIPWSGAKIEAIQDLIPQKDRVNFYINIFQYHSRWNDLDKKDFSKIEELTFMNGSMIAFGIKKLEPLEIIKEGKVKKIPKVTMEYLDKIVTLCKDNDIELIFTMMPYYPTTHGEWEIINGLTDVAESYNIDYINMFKHLDEINFDFETDMIEEQHVNNYGSDKVTHYVADYLENKFEFRNKKSDNEYNSWNSKFDLYNKYKKEMIKKYYQDK